MRTQPERGLCREARFAASLQWLHLAKSAAATLVESTEEIRDPGYGQVRLRYLPARRGALIDRRTQSRRLPLARARRPRSGARWPHAAVLKPASGSP